MKSLNKYPSPPSYDFETDFFFYFFCACPWFPGLVDGAFPSFHLRELAAGYRYREIFMSIYIASTNTPLKKEKPKAHL